MIAYAIFVAVIVVCGGYLMLDDIWDEDMHYLEKHALMTLIIATFPISIPIMVIIFGIKALFHKKK